MTAPTLPATLSRLAELLPERVRFGPSWQLMVYIHRFTEEHEHPLNWLMLGLTSDSPDPETACLLEYALREECEARGWWWRVSQGQRETGEYAAYVWRGWHFKAPGFEAAADTPAHALALALLGALEGGAR